MNSREHHLLSVNHDFLVGEIPMDDTLEAIKGKGVLTRHDFDQLRTLRHQGRRAMARYFLAVVPQRGSHAFQAFLESLVEANAQHLVDLLLQQAGVRTVDDLKQESDEAPTSETPSDTPLPRSPDPHEYVVRLTKNNKLLRRFVDPAKIGPTLTQNKVMTEREEDMLRHLHGRNKKWDLIMAVALQRGERAYQALMAALLKNDYSTVFHTINETQTGRTDSDDSLHSYHTDDDNADEDYDEEVLNSDEDIKQEMAQWSREEPEEDDKSEDQTESKADDTMLKRSRDLASITPRQQNRIDDDNHQQQPHQDDNVHNGADTDTPSVNYDNHQQRSHQDDNVHNGADTDTPSVDMNGIQ